MIQNQENGTLAFENENAKGVRLYEANGVEYVQDRCSKPKAAT